jgi:hypothetical protein
VTLQPGCAPGNCDPIAIPAVGAVLDLAPGQWRFDGQQRPVRVRVDRVLWDRSRTYAGEWVWVQGLAEFPAGAEPDWEILVRVDAIPPACRDTKYQPAPAARTYTIDVEDVAPGVVVRVGKGAIDRFTHSIFLRITKVVDIMPDGRVVFRGNRVTPVGRPIEHLIVCVPADMLYPEVMT